ncbi:Putative major facilitator superfamily, MFS transporter superfamily [Septoria linicola]|uniref:Major facilitator superfamily, MFS transporter superfamily n=1 Tax=Septoria linicola TaxID=215465 RepID=A0A9Q9EIN6_9PEZI|nr:Putative major facilitator superfamily, MFS transporter superfamily [Septoria linicola]
MPPRNDERRPLLEQGGSNGDNTGPRDDRSKKVEFDDKDSANPREWPLFWKYSVVFQITMTAFFLPMASSIFAPAGDLIAEEFGVSKQLALLNQSGFVAMLGIGPLFLAPMSETFGRRTIYLICLAIFTLLQIPCALAPNLATFVTFRTLSGLFGSVGVGNGGGSIADMFDASERAKVLGFYMIAPLLAPSVGPAIGGAIVSGTSWRALAWLMLSLAGFTTITSYFFMWETRAITILQQRKTELEKKHPDTTFHVEGVSNESIPAKIAGNSTRAVKILATQPIVLIMSIYQALIFSTMYSLYASYSGIWSAPPYEFNKSQLGLAYLAPALGFVITAFAIVIPYIDKIYDKLSERNDDDGQPEYRLPLANIGAVFLPLSLFVFGWTVQKETHWAIPLAAMIFFGASQASIFNSVQTYYTEAYESNAASALAAGSFLRSMVGGVVPLFASSLFDKLGYGWGMSVFGFIAAALMPAPLLFFWLGRGLREKYPFKG